MTGGSIKYLCVSFVFAAKVCKALKTYFDLYWVAQLIVWFDSYDVGATMVNQAFQNSSSESIIMCHYIWKMINVFVRIWQMFNSTMKRELLLTKMQRLMLKFILLCHVPTIIQIINLLNAWNTIDFFGQWNASF